MFNLPFNPDRPLDRYSSRIGVMMSAAVISLLVCLPGSGANAQEDASEDVVDEIVITGSRRQGRSPTDLPVPVDIIGAEQLINQGPSNISELLRTAIPSFNVSEQPISGTGTSVRPANLRGLSPDHVLILMNGKRRHRSADIPTFGTALMIGSQGADLASIPAIALKQVQVLRDGAAAQYGADAIAGVMNFILRDNPDEAIVEVKFGQFSEGDGDLFSIAGTFGLPLGNDGFITFSGEYSESDGTNRARSENLGDIQALVDAGITEAADENVVWGAPEINDNIKLVVNMAVDAGDSAELYAFGTYAERETIGGFFYRNVNGRDGIFTSAGNRLVGDLTPNDANFCLGTVAGGGLVVADGSPADQAVIAAAAADPDCFTWANVFPGGYSPLFGSQVEDSAATLGLRGETDGGWRWDASVGYGSNELTFNISNVTSPSFGGPDAITSFDDLGSRKQEELVINLDLSKEYEVGLASPLNVAFGYEYHQEEWSVRVGQAESFDQGPLFTQGFSSGTDGYFGYGPASAGSFKRNNSAVYIDLEADVSDNFLLGGAIRHEEFNDLGGETTGKLSAMFKFNDAVAIRATVSSGFHAPTPAQQNIVYAVTEGDGDGNLTESGIIPPDNTVAAANGGVPAVPEKSQNVSVGLVFETDSISATIDVYRIDVEDRISLSSSFPIDDEDRRILAEEGFVGLDSFQTIQFFTNDFETETSGVDVIINYAFDFGSGSSNLTFAANWNETKVTKKSDITSDTQVFSLENGLPETRGSLTWNHATDNWRGLLQANYYDDSISVLFGCCALPTGTGTTFDAEFGYSITDNFEVSIGGQNIFDETPTDVSDEGISGAVGTQYAPETPWSFNGAFYYARAVYTFQ